MTEKTLFFVQPYVVKRHKLIASGALTFVDDGDALEVGAELARRRAGVVVMSQSYDAERHAMSRPKVLRIHGKVPEGWSETREAA
jgi:hypothetical protein